MRILSTLSVLLVTCLMISNGHAATTLKIATLSPDGSFWMQKMREGANEIKKQTNGRVKFKFYPGGVMGDDKTVLRKMRFGQLHGAAFTNGSLNIFYPDIQLYNLILKFKSLDEIDHIRKHFDPILQKGLEDNKIVSLGFAEIGFAYLMSTKPIASINDLRNQKAWVPENNNIAQAAIEAFSVSPIPLSIRDVLVGLQTGMVNVVAGSPVGALALQWHTQVKYITDLPLSYIFGVLAMDSKAFKKISTADQKIVRQIMGDAIQEIEKRNRTDNVAAIEAIKNQGIEFIKPSEQAATELRELITGANQQLTKTGKLSQHAVDKLNQQLAQLRLKQTQP